MTLIMIITVPVRMKFDYIKTYTFELEMAYLYYVKSLNILGIYLFQCITKV